MNRQVKKCTFEMLSDREYDISKNINFDDDLFYLYKKNKKYGLKFILNDFKTSQIKDIINSVLENDEQDICTLFVVVNNTFNIKIENVEIFYAKNLRINITKHIMTPKHELVNEVEYENLKKLGIKNLPIIFETDPMIRWYGWKAGSICKITRESSFYYRLIKN